MTTLAKEIYGAEAVEFSELAKKQIETYTKQGYGNLPSESQFSVSLPPLPSTQLRRDPVCHLDAAPGFPRPAIPFFSLHFLIFSPRCCSDFSIFRLRARQRTYTLFRRLARDLENFVSSEIDLLLLITRESGELLFCCDSATLAHYYRSIYLYLFIRS